MTTMFSKPSNRNTSQAATTALMMNSTITHLQHQQHHEIDYAVWCEWVQVSRNKLRLCNNLLDSSLDPMVEHHMTLKRKDMSKPLPTASAWMTMVRDNVDEANVVPPKLQRRSPCALSQRAPQRREPVGLNNLVSSTSSSWQRRRRIVTAARTPRSRAAAAAHALAESVLQQQPTVVRTNNKSNDEQQQQQQHQQMRWPNLEEVERALDGCCLEVDALLAWKKGDAHTNSKSHRSLDTTTSTLTYPSMQCDQQQTELPPPPPDLVRVSTSTILGEQTEIWRQIQLERQDNVGTVTPTPTAATADSNNNNNDSQNLGSSLHTFNSYSTHQEPQLRHLEPHQDLAVEFTTPRSSGKKTHVSPLSPSTPTSTKSPSSSPIRRYQGHSTFSSNSNSNKKKTYAPTTPSSSRSRGAKTTAPGVTHRHRRRRPKPPVAAETVFVPCPICQAPLEISKEPPTERVGIICYNCNAAASSELIRSFIGVSCCDNNKNNNTNTINTIEEENSATTNPAL